MSGLQQQITTELYAPNNDQASNPPDQFNPSSRTPALTAATHQDEGIQHLVLSSRSRPGPGLTGTQQQQQPTEQSERSEFKPGTIQHTASKLLLHSRFSIDQPLLTPKLLALFPKPLAEQAEYFSFSQQHPSDSQLEQNDRFITALLFLKFTRLLSKIYTHIKELRLQLDALTRISNAIVAQRMDVIHRFGLLSTTFTSHRARGWSESETTTPTYTIRELTPDRNKIHEFYTTQCRWTPHEVNNLFTSNSEVYTSLGSAETSLDRLSDGLLSVIVELVNSVSGGPPGYNYNTTPPPGLGVRGDLRGSINRAQSDLETIVRTALVVEREIDTVRKLFALYEWVCPDWNIRDKGLLIRRVGSGVPVSGLPWADRWVIVDRRGDGLDGNGNGNGDRGDVAGVDVNMDDWDEVDWLGRDVEGFDEYQQHQQQQQQEGNGQRMVGDELRMEMEMDAMEQADENDAYDADFMYDDEGCVMNWMDTWE